MGATSFENVEVWRKAHQFVLEVYKMTESFPKYETYGLTSQLRRAAVSIPANLAEGFGKPSKPDKIRFYSISQGSIEECRYYMILARDLGYADTLARRSDLDEIARMLAGYIAAIKRAI